MTNDNCAKDEGCACGCGGPGRMILMVLAVVIVGALIAKNAGRKPAEANPPAVSEPPAVVETTSAAAGTPETATQGKALPRLVDLGATECIPCKKMAPILEDLKKAYAGKMDVQFIDVWKNPDAGSEYGIDVIPTQIFYDAEGKELFRHEGFLSKEDILAKWKELGVDLGLVGEVDNN